MIATRRLLVGAGAPLYELATGRRPWTEYRSAARAPVARPGVTRRARARAPSAARAARRRPCPVLSGRIPTRRRRSRGVRTLDDLGAVCRSPAEADLRPGFPDAVTADNLPASRRFRTETSGSTGLPFEFYNRIAPTSTLASARSCCSGEWAGTRRPGRGPCTSWCRSGPRPPWTASRGEVERARQLFLGTADPARVGRRGGPRGAGRAASRDSPGDRLPPLGPALVHRAARCPSARQRDRPAAAASGHRRERGSAWCRPTSS